MCYSYISVRIWQPLLSTSASQSVSTAKWIPLMKSKGIKTTLRDIIPRLTKSEKQEQQQNEKEKESFKIITITEVTLLTKSVTYYLFTWN